MDKINLQNKKVLVTGGRGYLGSALVEKLESLGAIVYIIDRTAAKRPNYYTIDITDINEVQNIINNIRPDIIYHLAASLNRTRDFDDFDMIHKVNYLGTYNLLHALKSIAYKNFIFTSTSEIYGDNPPPFDEGQIPDPASPYSLTKINAENLIKTFSKLNNKNYTILRLFNFFGKNMPRQFFIPQMINSLQNEDTFKMTEGEQKRDFLFLDDVIQGLLLSVNDKAKNQILNLCSSKAVSLKEIVLECKQKLRSHCNIEFGALPYRENEVWNMVGDNSKIKKLLNFRVEHNLEKAIEKIIN